MPEEKTPADPAKLNRKQLAQLLSKSGSTQASVEQIDDQISRGAPVNEDGTLHLVHFTAWLVQKVD